MSPVTGTKIFAWASRGEDAAEDSRKAWRRTVMRYIHRFVPVSRWYRTVTPKTAVGDAVAGFIVGVMIVPTSLSWSSLAGLPLSCGLIAALVASFSYGTFGQCASLSIGPVAEITTLLISIPGIPSAERKDTFQSLGVQVGLLSMVLSFVDCGTVIKTIFAKAVGDGYTCAAALLAISAQLKVMFNVVPTDLGYGNFINTMIALVEQWSVNCIYCFALFMVYCTYLIQIKKTRLPLWIPHQLIIVVVSILLTWGFRLDERLNLAIVRDIPASLSLPHFPPMDNLIGLGPYTLTITVISFVQMYVVAQRVMPDIDPNAELFAGGVTNLLANLMSGMPVSNSFSCSSVLIEQKVHTPLTAYSAGTVVLITILFLTRLGVFYYLPKHALAAIVVSSVWRLVNFSGPAQLWRYSRKDAGVWVLTFVLTVIGGITIGVLSGIAFSLILVVLRIARPRAVSVGFNMQTFRYGDIRKDPELLVYPNILMWRFDAPLYFVNTGYFQERLLAAIAAEVRPVDVVLVTCGKIVDIDAAALASLPLILDGIAKSDPSRPRRIILTDIHGRLEKVLHDSAALPFYVPDEYDRLTIEHITASGKFPVVFKKLEEAIAFAQRCISERYGNVDTAPYPNVSFLTDVVMEAARLSTGEGCVPSLLSLLEAEGAVPAGATSASGGDTPAAAGGDASAGTPTPHMVVTAPGEAPPPPRRVQEGRGGRGEASVATASVAAAAVTAASAGAGVRSSDDDDDDEEDDRAGCSERKQDSLVHHLQTLKKLSTYSPDRELVGVLGVIRHGEVTPKQKKKLLFSDPTLMRLAFQGRDLRRTKRSPEELADFFAVVERLLWGSPASNLSTMGSADCLETSVLGGTSFVPTGRFSTTVVENWARVLAIVRSRPDGLKIQLKTRRRTASGAGSFAGSGRTSPQLPASQGGAVRSRQRSHSHSSSGSADDDAGELTAGLLVVKWGGVLTKSGISQAHVMGEKLFARFYAAGDLPLRRLVQFTRQPIVTASDENRVVNTALVVSNALTQTSGVAVHRGDIVLNDGLMKILSPVARRLLREEYRYFESLLHIESAAAARHFFHIPGFRQLLWIPPLDRPLGGMGSFEDADDGGEAGDDGHARDAHDADSDHTEEYEDERSEDDAAAAAARRGPAGARGRHSHMQQQQQQHRHREAARTGAPPHSFHFRGNNSGDAGRDGSVLHGSRAFTMVESSQSAQQRPNYNVLRQDEFYTPFQVLQELEELMTVLSTLEFPSYMAKVALSSHETLAEVQQRYESMLSNFRGAKRRILGGVRPGRGVRGGLGPGTPSRAPERARGGGGGGRGAATAGAADAATSVSSVVAASAATSDLREDLDQQFLLEAMEDTGGSSDEEDGLDTQLLDETDLGAEAAAGHHEGHRAASGAHRPTGPAVSTGAASHAGAGGGGDGGALPRSEQRRSAATPPPVPPPSRMPPSGWYQTPSGPLNAPPGFDHTGRTAVPRFDVSDVSKLRDYGSYDVAYNLPLLLQLHASVQDPAAAFQLRRFGRSLQRFSDLTEYMSRVGENVLEGVNSSKRFIIGSLVGNELLHRLHDDFRDLAATDEERGVHELLLKAQMQYMTENGGVEKDVLDLLGLCARLPCWPAATKTNSAAADAHARGSSAGGAGAASVSSAATGGAWARETPQQREFRLRFPFIALPKQEACRRAAATDFAGCTRLYFTSYLHVEGVLQCLFESATVEGFSRPSKEEMEATHQLYMRHLVFKIFRRRNFSYTDAEVAAAMRQLHLLFRSDVDYDRQQRELRRGLGAIYHAMYYVSMEAYLSLGDADDTQSAETAAEFPLFTLNRPGEADQDAEHRAGEEAEEEEIVVPMSIPSNAVTTKTTVASTAGAAPPPPPLQLTSPVVEAATGIFASSLPLPAFSVTGGGAVPHTAPGGRPPGGAAAAAAGVTTPFARSPLFVERRVTISTEPASCEDGSAAWRMSPVEATLNVAAGSAVLVAAGSGAASDSNAEEHMDAEGDPLSCTRGRRVSNASTLALAPPPQRRPGGRSRSAAAMPNNAKDTVREATVLVTPEAGRRTAVVQEMKHRVSNVTPMRRIHEGLSLNDFVLLMKEVESAVRSQTSSSSVTH